MYVSMISNYGTNKTESSWKVSLQMGSRTFKGMGIMGVVSELAANSKYKLRNKKGRGYELEVYSSVSGHNTVYQIEPIQD